MLKKREISSKFGNGSGHHIGESFENANKEQTHSSKGLGKMGIGIKDDPNRVRRVALSDVEERLSNKVIVGKDLMNGV